MAFATIREADSDDITMVEQSAKSFAQRHNINVTLFENATMAVDYETIYNKKLARLWHKCVERAVREPGAEQIAYGYVGYNIGD